MKLTILQPELSWENVEANLSKLETMMDSLSGWADIIILPEMFSTGFTMNTALCEGNHGLTFIWMKEQALKRNCGVCGSYLVRDEERAYNRFVFVSPDQDYMYDKRHLFSIGDEDKFFTRGRSRVTFDFRGFRIIPFICYDLRFPVWSRNRNDYDLAIYVSSWPEARINVWNTLLKARAIENQCFVAGSNRVGCDGNGICHNGMSQIINFRGELIAGALENEEGIVSADISMDELTTFRNKFNVLRDADDFSLVF